MDPVLGELYTHLLERFEHVFDEAHAWDGRAENAEVPEDLFRLHAKIEKLRDAITLLGQELEELEVEADGSTQGPQEIWRPARIAP